MRDSAKPRHKTSKIEPREGDGGLEASVDSAAQRGRHVLPAVATRATGPLGLARWDHKGRRPRRPARVPGHAHGAPAGARRRPRALPQDQGVTARGPLGLGTEFELIRDYQPDDDIRQVNWRATARLGRPMSNQYRLEQDRDLLLLIDAGRLSSAPLGERRDDDPGRGARRRRRVGPPHRRARRPLAAPSRSTARCAPRSRRAARAALTSCARCSTSSRDPLDSDYELAFRRAEGSKRALVVVLCDLLEEAAARRLVRAVPVLTPSPRRDGRQPVGPGPRGARGRPRRSAYGWTRPQGDGRGDVLAPARTRGRAGARGRRAGAGRHRRTGLPAVLVAAYLRAKARAVL